MDEPLSALNLPKYVLQQLRSLGFNDCRDLLNANEKTKESFPDLKNLMQTPSTKSALDIFQEECLLGSIPTLIRAFDDVLEGGIPIGLITEIAGDVDTKKTELWLVCFV